MVTMAQRIEALREEKGLSRPALAAALGLPKNSPEKFETGRSTPTKEQQEKMAQFFGVSIFYLRGESSDRTRQDAWLDMEDTEPHVPIPTAPKRVDPPVQTGGEGSFFDAFRNSKPFQEMIRATVLEVLRSPEGQELLDRAVRRGSTRQK